MNPEILERLLMDRSLGALGPETSQLLDAYLRDHPECQRLADSIEQTVMLGREALKPKKAVELPIFPKERMLSAGRHAKWRSMRQWLSIAASLVIGVGIGLSGVLSRETQPVEHVGFSAVQTQPELSGLKSAQAFWSPRTYVSLRESSGDRQQRRLNENKYQKQIEKYRKRGLLWIED